MSTHRAAAAEVTGRRWESERATKRHILIKQTYDKDKKPALVGCGYFMIEC